MPFFIDFAACDTNAGRLKVFNRLMPFLLVLEDGKEKVEGLRMRGVQDGDERVSEDYTKWLYLRNP